ncbi:MAG: hypothetical protein OHK0046_35920 [Anaerolineae bacterium]
MAEFKVYWQDEAESILMWEYPREYSMNDLMVIGLQVRTMLMETQAPRIDIVMVMHNANATGNNMLTMLNNAYDTMPPQVKSMFFVAPSTFAKLIIRMLDQLNEKARKTTHIALSTDAALQEIAQMRSTDTQATNPTS